MKQITGLALLLTLLTTTGCWRCHSRKQGAPAGSQVMRDQIVPGRWQVTQTKGGNWLKIDTATGDAWLGVVGQDSKVTWQFLGAEPTVPK